MESVLNKFILRRGGEGLSLGSGGETSGAGSFGWVVEEALGG